MSVEDQIRQIASQYAERLKSVTQQRLKDMANDNTSHFLIYQVLGISNQEGLLIDIYQNKGRFLYKYAGSLLETAAKLCFKQTFPDSGSVRIPNTQGRRPNTFEIDCLVNTDAIEIKWRDATTDGDHITKEHNRIITIAEAGYTPIRIMFYYPNRVQAIRIQQILETLYAGVNGHYYYGDAAWRYIKERTGIDLKAILETIAAENMDKNVNTGS